jgi:hypothetical protein
MKSVKRTQGLSLVGTAAGILASFAWNCVNGPNLADAAEISSDVAPSLTDIVRNADGSVHYMNQLLADKYCRDQGSHLATARELALVAQSLGAQGISETAKDGYLPVYGSYPEGGYDNFYYSGKGYQRPPGDLGNLEFWSSSHDPHGYEGSDGPHYGFDAYVLFGDDGGIYTLSRALDLAAVLCVRSR